MEFGFRAGDRRPRCPSPDRRLRSTPPQAGPIHGEPPPPPSPFEWEAAALRVRVRERIIREEVERRLIEEEVRRELALARARFHGGFGPVPFVGPDGPTVVPLPPPQGPAFFMPDGPFTPPMPLPMMSVGMHPNRPPPPLFGPWEGFGPRRFPGFGQPMLINETRTRPLPPPPKLRHTLQLRQIAPRPSESSEVLSSETRVSGVKRKADTSSATAKPTKLQNASSATTKPTKLQTAARDWSCALCQVSTNSEAGLNQHLEGKKHKAKLVQCGMIKVTRTNKIGLQVTNDAGPSDAPKKIHVLVDGETHQVVQKSNCVWCERCRVSCTNAAAMADHLRGKKHSLLNRVWTSIKAVRKKEVKEDSAAISETERKVSEDSHAEIPDEHEEEDAYMTSEFSGDGSFLIATEMKETTDMAEEADANSDTVIPVEIKKEDTDTDTASEVNRNCPAETKKQGTDMDVVMDVSKNFVLEVDQTSRNEANTIFLLKVRHKSRKKANKKILLKVRHKSRKKANKKILLKAHQKSRKKAKKWLGIRGVDENSSAEIPAEIPAEGRHNDETADAPTDLSEPAPRKEE